MRTVALLLLVACGDDAGTVPVDAPTASRLVASPTMIEASSMIGVPVEGFPIRVSNAGTAEATGITATIAGSADFTIASSTCSTLAPQDSCAVMLRFEPSALASDIVAELEVSAPAGSSATVTLRGTGTQPNELRVARDTTTSQLGYAAIGHTSARSITFTVTTVGAAPTGPLTTSFEFQNGFVKRSDTCAGQMLSSTGSCQVVVGFSPTVVGMRESSLIVRGTPGGEIRSSVQGIGVATDNIIEISPVNFAYPATTVGQTSAPQTFTVTNTGSVATGTLVTSMTQAMAGDFTITSDTCDGAVIAAAGTCTYAVAFAPTATGQRLTQFEVAGAGNPAGTTLLGIGQ